MTLWRSTPIIVVTQLWWQWTGATQNLGGQLLSWLLLNIRNGTRKELLARGSTPIIVVTQRSCLGRHRSSLPKKVNSYHSCYSTRESDVTKFINRSTLMLLLNPEFMATKPVELLRVNSYHSCYSPVMTVDGSDSKPWGSTPIMVVTQRENEKTIQRCYQRQLLS